MAVTTFPFDYRVLEPEPPWNRLVESLWYARGTVPYTRERIAPTGSTVAVFVLGDAIVQTPERGDPLKTDQGFLVGPHDQPVWNEPTGETFAVGIVATSVGCRALFDVAPASLRGSVGELGATWSDGLKIRDQLASAADPAAMLQALADWLETRAIPDDPNFGRCERAVALLVEDPIRPITEIAEEIEVSHAHLDRIFSAAIGLTPRTLARLLRLRRLLSKLDVREQPDWAALAQTYGWYDQAHFIRDFKRHTGVTPTQYVTAQRAAYGPDEVGDGAGFVPEV